MPAVDRGGRERPEHRRRWRRARAAGSTATGRSRSRVASYCSSCRRVRRRDEAVDRPAGQAEQPQLLGRRRIDGEPVGVVGVALRARAPRRCCGRARPRSRAAASASPARRRRARAAPTTRSRTSTRGRGEAADHLDQAAGDEVHRDRQRRAGHAEVEVARDGEVAGELRVLEVAHARRARRRLRSAGRRARPRCGRRGWRSIAWWIGVSTCSRTKTTPTATSGPVSGSPRCTAPTNAPVATANAAGSTPRSTRTSHHTVASR